MKTDNTKKYTPKYTRIEACSWACLKHEPKYTEFTLELNDLNTKTEGYLTALRACLKLRKEHRN